MRVLNLYAGIGGNRKLWTDVEVTAVELNPEIAKIYQDFFPNDKMIIADAHEYLLEHFKEFNFIWSSPPCPSHSKIRKSISVTSGQSKAIYPDMRLYEEIIFLRGYYDGLFAIENVESWYEPLIKPQISGKHYFWANFIITNWELKNRGMQGGKKSGWPKGEFKRMSNKTGFNLDGYKIINKLRLLRNCTEPELGLHILNCARGIYQHTRDINQLSLI